MNKSFFIKIVDCTTLNRLLSAKRCEPLNRFTGNKKQKAMIQQYVYFNDKEAHFFTAINNEAARNNVINTFDLSFNASFLPVNIEVIDIDNVKFSVKNTLFALNLKKHFRLIGTGNNTFIFSAK